MFAVAGLASCWYTLQQEFVTTVAAAAVIALSTVLPGLRPLAILALKQGLGRLLRHRQDRGVLAVLDPRLRTMTYGQRFLASLPPSPVTSQLEDIERFMEC